METAPESARLASVLAFLQSAEALKDTLRSGRTAGGRPESTAEHSWRLCLTAMMFASDLPGVDVLKLLKLCIVHDLGEAVCGDVPATDQRPDDGRAAREREGLAQLCALLPADLRDDVLVLADEYAAGVTPEAVLAKGFDKLETMLQHLAGKNPPGFDYGFNLSYGRAWTDRHPLTAALREIVDAQTRARITR